MIGCLITAGNILIVVVRVIDSYLISASYLNRGKMIQISLGYILHLGKNIILIPVCFLYSEVVLGERFHLHDELYRSSAKMVGRYLNSRK